MSGEEPQTDPCDECPALNLQRIVGFNGSVKNGLHLIEGKLTGDKSQTPSMMFPLGASCIIESMDRNVNKQHFFRGHSNPVSAIAVSPCGKFLASGQVTHMGYKATINVYTLVDRQPYATFTLHKVKIEALAFSCDSKLLYSLGGQDDGSVVVWDMEQKKSICASPCAPQTAGCIRVLAASHHDPFSFITAGDKSIRVWNADLKNRKLVPEDCNLGVLKRDVLSVSIDPQDKYLYCGTTTGDVLKINFETKLLVNTGPTKNLISLGIGVVKELGGKLLIGSGNGDIAVLDSEKSYRRISSSSLPKNNAGGITSLVLNENQIFVGTNANNVYRIPFCSKTLNMIGDPVLLKTCHKNDVNDIVFPANKNELFATAGVGDVRIWQTTTGKELRRIEIKVPNITCHALAFSPDGNSLVTAWSDGRLRAYLPVSGKLIYEVPHAHHLEATALAITNCNTTIISGGCEGAIRIWRIDLSNPAKPVVSLEETMKEHKCKVTTITLSKNNRECATSSEDGTCIMWDLATYKRSQMVMANTLFQCLVYNYEENQIVTSGTDRKIAYWETLDGSPIRELEGSMSGAINGMDITQDGHKFITGGDDKLVKVWDYDSGNVTHVGRGHSDRILKLKLSPDNKHLVSVSCDGAIAIWRL
jgi:WD40 repeat protein